MSCAEKRAAYEAAAASLDYALAERQRANQAKEIADSDVEKADQQVTGAAARASQTHNEWIECLLSNGN